MEKVVILNIAGGKIKPDLPVGKNTFLINIDTGYYGGTSPADIEKFYRNWLERDIDNHCVEFYCNEDIFTFLSRTTIMFDEIKCYRFLEHVPFDQVLSFIYLLSTVTKKDSVVDIIVPNYRTLAKRILHEDVNSPDFEKENITTTTELLNERNEPHASIWTIARAQHYFALEGRFEITWYKLDENFDGRDIYLRFYAKRI